MSAPVVDIDPAGTMPAYSNYGAALAGYMVERTSGLSFDDYLEQNIFAPLGMKHASFRQPLPAAMQDQMAQGYEVASGEPQPFEIVSIARHVARSMLSLTNRVEPSACKTFTPPV